MSTAQLSTEQLRQALQLSEQIEQLQQQLNSVLGGTGGPTPAAASTSGGSSLKGRKLSPATLRKMRAAQQARWAKIRGGNGGASAKPAGNAKPAAASAGKKRGKLTPEGRAKLAAAMKARWAARKEGAPAPNAAGK